MVELGQLEAHHGEFEGRKTRVVVVSVEDQAAARQSQNELPHLMFIADEKAALCAAFDVVHPKAGPHGEDIAAPTTFLIDGQGRVRWVYRSERVFARLSPQELLQAVDEHLAGAAKP